MRREEIINNNNITLTYPHFSVDSSDNTFQEILYSHLIVLLTDIEGCAAIDVESIQITPIFKQQFDNARGEKK